MTNLNIAGKDKAALLVALYNASRPLGLGALHYTPEPLSKEEAAGMLEQTKRFDYLRGRVMKVDLSGDELNPRLYDRDNGEGACERAIRGI